MAAPLRITGAKVRRARGSGKGVRQVDEETGRQGDKGTRGQGEGATRGGLMRLMGLMGLMGLIWRRGDKATRGRGDKATRRKGDKGRIDGIDGIDGMDRRQGEGAEWVKMLVFISPFRGLGWLVSQED